MGTMGEGADRAWLLPIVRVGAEAEVRCSEDIGASSTVGRVLLGCTALIGGEDGGEAATAAAAAAAARVMYRLVLAFWVDAAGEAGACSLV